MKKFTTSILALFIVLGGFAQEANYGPDKDKCLEKISLYSGYLKQKAYTDAYRFWIEAVETCPEYKPVLYSNGIYILKQLMKDDSFSAERKANFKDSIAVVYEAGIKIFGATPDVLEDYGNDLIVYTGDFENGVAKLKEAIDGLNQATKYSTIMYYSQALKNLEINGTKDCEELIKEYERLSQINELNAGKTGYDKAQEAVDKYLGSCLTCDKLVPLAEKKFELAKTNADERDKLFQLLSSKECTDNKIYKELAIMITNEKPSVQGYEGLAIIMYNDGKKDEALSYFEKAFDLAQGSKKEELLTKAAGLALAAGKDSKANKYANQLLDLNPNNGEAYLIKASMAASSGCGNNAFEKTTKYWVAYDLAAKAKSVDSSIADKANKAMNQYSARFPERTELFAQGLKEGESYSHCSGASTTVRGK